MESFGSAKSVPRVTDVFILSATRNPLGAFRGTLAAQPAPRLGAAAIRQAVSRAQVAQQDVTDVLMGNVLRAGQGQAPARQAALQAGLPPAVRTATVNKVCGSGLQAVMQAAHALAAGVGSVIVAGGMENMSLAPYLLLKARGGFRLGHQQVVDSLVADGLWDPHHNLHMGGCAEHCAARYGFTRAQQDAYAIESFRRANRTQAAGGFADEITPVALDGTAGTVGADEGPARVNYEKIPTLRPALSKEGTITAANASSLNDGAAALVLAGGEVVRTRGLRPVARVVAFGAHAQEPDCFTTAPVEAALLALRAAGWQPCEVDLWEVNEAFAVVPLAFMAELGAPPERVNVCGGAIALGHPIGASGARILVTLLAALRASGLKRGVAAVCIGGGEGLAACVELA